MLVTMSRRKLERVETNLNFKEFAFIKNGFPKNQKEVSSTKSNGELI